LVSEPTLEPYRDYWTRSKAKTSGMAPAKAEEPLAQLLAKIEEGNRETHRRMELMQGALGNMETAVKGVMSEQEDL
jgi:hypothetical protein